VHVRKEGFNLVFIAKALINKRVSATLAAPCYDNITSEEELNKYKDWFVGKAAPERREKGSGRPTKKERREIEEYKDDIYFDFDE
jgi:ribosome-associated heat shock protein Hsp15